MKRHSSLHCISGHPVCHVASALKPQICRCAAHLDVAEETRLRVAPRIYPAAQIEKQRRTTVRCQKRYEYLDFSALVVLAVPAQAPRELAFVAQLPRGGGLTSTSGFPRNRPPRFIISGSTETAPPPRNKLRCLLVLFATHRDKEEPCSRRHRSCAF